MRRTTTAPISQPTTDAGRDSRRPAWRRAAAIAGLLPALLALGTSPAHAMERLSGTDVVVGAEQVIDDDLFVIAQAFTLNGTVNGDLIVAAGSITINGTVQNDLEGIGQTLVINGGVGEDVRVAALAIDLGPDARLGDDLLSAAVRLESRPGSRIDGQLLNLGVQTVVEGSVGGDGSEAMPADTTDGASPSGGASSGDTAPGGAAPARSRPTGTPTSTPVPSGAAGLGGSPQNEQGVTALVAWRAAGGAPNTGVSVPPSQDEATDEADDGDAGSGSGPLGWLLTQLRRMAALLLVGLVIVWLIPDKTTAGAEQLARGPLPSLGWGVVAIPALVMAFLVVLTATLSLVYVIRSATLDDLLSLALALGAMAMVSLVVVWILAVSYVGYIVAALAIGRFILRRAKPEWAERPYIPLTLGTAILVLLMAIPGVGSAIGLVALLMGLGALWLLWCKNGSAWPRRGSAPGEVGEVAVIS